MEQQRQLFNYIFYIFIQYYMYILHTSLVNSKRKIMINRETEETKK